MADIPASAWSETAASNTAAAPDGWPSNSAPTIVYSTDREMMGAIKREWNRNNPTVTCAGTNTVTLTYTTAPAAYVRGMRFSWGVLNTNTGASTLNVNSLGAKNIFMDGAALVGGEMVAGTVVEVLYDGIEFEIVSSRSPQSIDRGGINQLINPSFEVWQRGAGGSASFALSASTGSYTADRWFVNVGANEASVASQVAGLTNQSRWAHKLLRNNGQTGTTAMTLEQPYTTDMAVAARGQIVTVSFTAKAGANYSPTSGALAVIFYTGTGSEARRASGSFTNEATPINTTVTLTTTATRFSVTSSAVATNITQASLLFAMTPTGTAGADDSFTIDDVQFEFLPVMGAFDPLGYNFAYQLGLCQRFYQKGFNYSVAPAQATGAIGAEVALPTGASGTFAQFIQLCPNMRAVNVTTYNPVSSNANWRDATNSADRTATVTSTTVMGFSIRGASGVAGSINQIAWQNDGDI